MGPGVQVIADVDEPIFYADSFYWRFDGGTWYRSRDHRGGWSSAQPPTVIGRIERPHEYSHYRPAGWIAGRSPDRPAPVAREPRENRAVIEHRQVEPIVRPAPAPVFVAPPPPAASPPVQVAPPPRATPQPVAPQRRQPVPVAPPRPAQRRPGPPPR